MAPASRFYSLKNALHNGLLLILKASFADYGKKLWPEIGHGSSQCRPHGSLP